MTDARGWRAALLGGLLALLLCATAQAAPPAVGVQGNRLVDAATGATWLPHGVNWPSFEYACTQGWGYSTDATDAAAVAVMAGWHINAVRIPLNQDCWLGDDGRPATSHPGPVPDLTVDGYRAALAGFVNRLNAAGIVAILDLHWSGPDGVVADGQRAMPDDRTPEFWTSVASAFKDRPAVMFDVFNEPYSRWDEDAAAWAFTLTWDCWKTGLAGPPGFAACTAPTQNDTERPLGDARYAIVGMQQLVTAIRTAGATQPIMLGGLDYANDLRDWLAYAPDDPAHALVASFHNYQKQRCSTAACWDSEIAPVAAQVPVVTGEFGEEDCRDTFDTAYMDWADAHGIGYLAWAWWVLDAPNCAQLAMISDAAGTPQAPNGTALKARLDAFAAQDPHGGDGGGDGGGGNGGGGGDGPVQRPDPGPPPPSNTPPAAPRITPAAVGKGRLATAKATVRKRKVALRLACPKGGATCRGRITLAQGRTRLASARVSVPAGRTRTVTLSLTRKAVAAVAKRGRKGARVTATLVFGARTTHAAVRLRAT